MYTFIVESKPKAYVISTISVMYVYNEKTLYLKPNKKNMVL